MSLEAPVVTVRAQDQLLGDTPTEQAADLALQCRLAVAVAILLRQEHGHAERPTARNDADLVHRVVLGHQATDDRVSRLVVGGELLLSRT
jgi:hypothetical protein